MNIKSNDTRIVKLTSQQFNAINALNETRKGGCASVIGYRPTSNWVVSPIHNIQMITRISIQNLYQRRIDALKDVTVNDILPFLRSDSKLGNLTFSAIENLFNTRKEKMITTLEKTLNGDRSDSHRQAHDLCYTYVDDIKIHLVTTKSANGNKIPVISEDGSVIADSIMIPYLELNVTEKQKGKRKIVNSGTAVLMGNMIERVLNKRSVKLKMLSLKTDNFEAFHIDHKEFLPEHVVNFGNIIN